LVEAAPLPEGTVRIPAERIRRLVAAAFGKLGVPVDDAELVAEVLVSADLRGIRSHGVARMSYFLTRIQKGVINRHPHFHFEPGSQTTGLLHADNSIGIVAASRAMDQALAMAEEHGCGLVAVTASSHFGYAGYWAGQACRRGLIGIAMSNSGGRVAPTFSTESILGTNPLAVAIPGGGGGTDFLLDMATSAVAVGKVETALSEGRLLPPGWVAELETPPRLDSNGVLSFEAPLLPLGGAGDLTGGHKGYGLGLLVELLCGALAGGGLAERIAGSSGDAPAAMGHFLGAIQVSGFRSPRLVEAEMAETFRTIRHAHRAPGQDRIYIHGEPEKIAEAENSEQGIALTPALQAQLVRWNRELELGFSLA
jgi:LDH2 family malate/lactate/ureidoglycolate dehydrogenase